MVTFHEVIHEVHRTVGSGLTLNYTMRKPMTHNEGDFLAEILTTRGLDS